MAKIARVGKAYIAKEGYVISLPRIVRTRVVKQPAHVADVGNSEVKKSNETLKEESKK